MDPLVEIDGRQLKLSNLEKVLYPKAGFTKAHVIDYYTRIAPVLLPHLQDRAVTLKRYPEGVEGPFFYEKRCPPHAPKWVRTAPIWSEGRGEDVRFCVLGDLPTLVWAANLADLELHSYLAKVDDPARPTALVFDLDPGPGVGIAECCAVALRVRDLLREFGLESFAKTSGSKGLQTYVPLNTPVTFDETKPFARAVGEVLERETPSEVTTNMSKAARPGKVFVDWSQNDDHKTTVCVYSLRARDEPTVSTPVAWREVEACADGGPVPRFTAGEVLDRVAARGDLFALVLTLEQALPTLV